MASEISRLLLTWYDHSARRLPWRGRTDSYAIWISEIMLQQTQVDTVIPYFLRWMELFPTLQTLAEADEQDILHAWEGLGYYSRARLLHRTAHIVMSEHNGSLPTTRMELEQLPGIGSYTAAAIASIAFDQNEAALDGNIRRVYARLYAMDLPVRSKEGQKHLEEWAVLNLPTGRAGDFNQALMDLGATLCTPRTPRCLLCPLNAHCQAQAQGKQDRLPITGTRPPVPHLIVTAAVILRSNQVLIAQRPPNGLLGGMWEFPGGKVEPGESLRDGLLREIQEELGIEVTIGDEFGIYNHAYTHFKVTLHAFLCTVVSGEPQPIQVADMAWVLPQDLENFPMGKIDRQIANRLVKHTAGVP